MYTWKKAMLSNLFIQIEYKKIHKERYLYQFIIYKTI